MTTTYINLKINIGGQGGDIGGMGVQGIYAILLIICKSDVTDVIPYKNPYFSMG